MHSDSSVSSQMIRRALLTLRDILRSLVETAPGSQGAAIINSEGVVVDTLTSGLAVEPASGLSEYGLVAQQLDSIRDLLNAGENVDYTIRTSERVTLVRRASPHYFVVVWVDPVARMGQARFRLRLAASHLAVYS